MIRIGSAIFNADHGHLADEMRRLEDAGVDFVHLDVFDGYFVPDLGFPARTIATLRKHSRLPFEVHLAANDPLRFVPALVDAGADLIFLPAETTPLKYEAVFAVREQGCNVGLWLSLGTPLSGLEPVLPMLDAVLLLARVTGESKRGASFNPFVLDRVRRVRGWIDTGGYAIDLQAAGGLNANNMPQTVAAGARSLPVGSTLYRTQDMGRIVAELRRVCEAALKRET